MSATDFTSPPSEKWNEIVNSSETVEEMRERMLAFQVASGLISRERGNGYGNQLTKEAENAVPAFVPSEAAAPSERRETFLQVVYPGGNSRFEVAAVSQEELDAPTGTVTRDKSW